MNRNLQIAHHTRIYLKIFFFCSVILSNAYTVEAQSELFLNGTDNFFNNGSLIFVNGNIHNNDALFTNTRAGADTGIIELRGNWTNTIVSGNYVSGGIERFSGNTNQLISGIWNGTTGNINQFYNLKINKSAGYVSLAQNTHIHHAGTLEFESSGGIIRTATASSSNTGDYNYYLYIRNPSINAISGYNWPAGTSKYIEGKLKREVNSTGTYPFPVGFRPTDKDGMEAYAIKFNTIPVSTGIVGYIRPATINVQHPTVLCDVGTDPGAGAQTFPMCNGPRDGIYDMYYLDLSLSHEWVAIADKDTAYNYDITFYPGNNLDDLPYYNLPSSCDGAYSGKRIRVLAKDGVVGGSAQTGAGNYAPFQDLVSYIWCDFDDNTLSAQTEFSSFRLFGTGSSAYTTLPVELTAFYLSPVDNTYFHLYWTTASENNNAGFEVERSEDGRNFASIGWVQGHGTTAIPNHYAFDDDKVTAERDYYYRLKQVDGNGKYTYSQIIRGRLKGDETFSISNIYPNPTDGECTVDIYAPSSGKLMMQIIDVLGQQINDINYDVQNGVNKIKIEAGGLASGSYIINFNYSGTTYTRKLIKNQ